MELDIDRPSTSNGHSAEKQNADNSRSLDTYKKSFTRGSKRNDQHTGKSLQTNEITETNVNL